MDFIICQRLTKCGVPMEIVEQQQPGLVAYLRHNRSKLPEVVSSVLLGLEEAKTVVLATGPSEMTDRAVYKKMKSFFRESVKWIQWLMFEEKPQVVLEELGKQNEGTQGVCGAVWGNNDIAYRCRTCEHDPTCAICVPCFKAGNHVNHDYSMIHTGGGCCDCGDETAWKLEGFCSNHRGPGQVQPLPAKYASSAEPVLGALLIEWKDRLLAAERVAGRKPKKWDSQSSQEKVAYMTTTAIVEMLLSFCKCSESLLNFSATLICASPGLLDVLLRTENFLSKKVVTELHELLFKLLGEPNFKYEFAKAFIKHYPTLISQAIQEGFDGNTSSPKLNDYPILCNFSVQIFTVPTLTPRLVTELNLLDMLLGNLKQLFIFCAGDDGRLVQASKGPITNQLYARLVEDIRYVMSHLEVAKYVARERPDLSKEWIQLLVFMQGMDPQMRVTSIHVEEENDQWFPPCMLEFQMAHIHSLFVTGAASVYDVKLSENKTLISEQDDSEDDGDVIRHAKVGRLSEESSVVRMVGRSSGSDLEMWEACQASASSFQAIAMQICNKDIDSATSPVPAALAWLITECIKSLDNWLGSDTAKDLRSPAPVPVESLTRKLVQWRGRAGRGVIRDSHSPISMELAPRVDANTNTNRGGIIRGLLHHGHRIALRSEPQTEEDRTGRTISTESDFSSVSEMDIDMANSEDVLGRTGINLEVERSSVLRLEEWPTINYDVSRQEISFHIPLHRMLSLSFHKAMELYDDELDQTERKRNNLSLSFSGSRHEFFRQLLGDCHPFGFSAFVMEHLLRLKVFCTQVRAGMWRRNGHSTFNLCECYHSVRWSADSLELDLFLLQCCAAMAPPEAFVIRVLERFGLSDYLSLDLIRPNEYEPTLAQEMLALIIRIVAERGFCGLSATESLKRELIRKLSVGDATRSQLLKALPPRLSDNKDLQEILDTVATYAHPSGMQQGKYSLRKNYWQELDLYHPRWSSRDLQIAEERYSRFCKASAVVIQLPRWRKPFYPLYNLSQIATSKAALQIIRSVVFYATFSESSSESRAPDGVLFMALHLLALGLDICSSTKSQRNHMANNEMLLRGSQISTLSEENQTMLMDTAISCDEQESPPLLAYAKEVIDVGNIDRPEVSNHQSLLSLLVLLLQKYESGSQQGIATESSHCNIALLVRNLLQKFAELHCGCMREIEKLFPSILHCSSIDSGKNPGERGTDKPEMSTYSSDVERKRAIARERQAAVMAKMKAAQANFVASLGSKETVEPNDSELKQGKPSLEEEETSEGTESIACSLCREMGRKSPTAFLTLVQRSRLLSFAEKGPPSWERSTHLNGDDLATDEKGEDASGSALDSGSPEDQVEWDMIQDFLDGVSRHGLLEAESLLEFFRMHLPNITNAILSDDSNTNLLVSEDIGEDESASVDDSDNGKEATSDLVLDGLSESLAGIGKGMAAGGEDVVSDVLADYVAAVYNVGSKQQQDPENQSEVPSTESPVPVSQPSTFDGFGPGGCDGVHISSCGHAVHQECLDRYLSSLRQRYNSRIIFEGVQIVDPSQGEFLCPVCRRLANSVLPVLPDGPSAGMPAVPSIFSYGESSILSSASQSIRLHQALTLLRNAEGLTSKQGSQKAASRHPQSCVGEIESLLHKLYTLYFPGKSFSKPASARINQSLVLWDVFRYSLLAAELAARSSRIDTIARNSGTSLGALYRVVNCSRGSVLSLLLQVAKATQSQSQLTVLLRTRGMQLFVGSISCGVSMDTVSTNSLTGNIFSILKHINKGKDFPDIQFWKRTADPVLIHDPFSSLIWMLFCLPSSLTMEIEPFISLVHLFYLVCLVQAIAYAGISGFPDSDLKFGSHSFIKSISTALSGTTVSQLYLENADTDLLLFPRELLILRLTLPYLRRCALLYTLIYSSSALLNEIGGLGETAVHMIDDHMENRDEILKELEELQHLEKLFHIPTLETIFDDKSAHDLTLRWCQHLSKETVSRSYKHVVRCLPARPFELMRLPYLYHDLLQRYIKECCTKCKTVPDQPALCLLCGTLCCAPSRRACCKKNECLRHALTCGAGIGVFLMIRRTNILLQRSARQAAWPSPYLDAFGEEDTDMQRGKPLYLSKERYAALTQMVVSHGLDHSSHVLLQTTREQFFLI